MYRVAIVEDDPAYAQLLQECLNTYQQEHQILFETQRFSNGMAFLMDYKADWDIVLMDIEMPHLNGMDTARRMREMDQDVCLIFVTNMAQYAIEGYEVRALDFVLKPVEYGLPVTTKADTRYHGYGMLSMRRVAEKYNGYMNAGMKDHIFKRHSCREM